MSSTYNSAFTVVDAHSSRELADDLGLNHNNHLPTTPFEASFLSPFNHSQTVSNSASPSYNISSTPGESVSEYSNYQPSELSEIEDEFFGVDFDAGVQRIDSLPSALLGSDAYQPAELNYTQQDQLAHEDTKNISETFTTSTFPLSPNHTSIPNTPSPRSEANDLNTRTTIYRHELTTELHNSRFPAFTSLAPTHLAIQLTPDHSGSSHTSAEGVEPSTMDHLGHSPHVTISQWGNEQSPTQPNTFIQSAGQYGSATNAEARGNQFNTYPVTHGPQISVRRDEEGTWRSSERTGQAGLDPESRKMIADIELPNLKEQEEQRRLEHKNIEVQEWRSQTGGSHDGEDEEEDQSYFNFANESWRNQADLGHQRNPSEEDNNIPPVDDAASIRENRLIEGQIYYSFKEPNEADIELMNQPHQWNDAPSLPFRTHTAFQPLTSNDAIRQWNGNADTISISSRAATWGTDRRHSAPSLLDYEIVTDGSFLKKLSIGRPEKGERHRSLSRFDQGLDRLANIVPNIVGKRSDSKLKRARISQNIPEDNTSTPHPRHNSHGSLAPPPRTTSFSRKPTPRINPAFAAVTGPLAAVGTTHTRSGSFSATATSPRSPTHLGLRSVIRRVRSRSEVTSHDKIVPASLVTLWRGHGGPPVPNLASPPIETDVKKSQPQLQPEVQDHDDDDEDDEEQVDDGDVKIELEQLSEPIIPTYEGFKDHVRRLNPDLDPQYNWLVSRIAHQQEIRYKNLLDLRVKHSQAIMARKCAAGNLCMALGGSARLLDAKGNVRDSERNASGLQLVTEFSDDSSPGEGALTDETFPQGVPLPPTRNLPAEFECQLCFKGKKFQKPSDWTKHVHEDVQPFTCTYDKCKEPKSFKRKADWVRHENERHRHLEWWVCQVDDCKHPCYRKDNFLQHLVREHKLPEPKQKTKAAIKEARLREPVWIMLEKCHHETQKKPQEELCKFCGKSFNTWKKLTVHLAKHMEYISLPVLRLVEVRKVDANTIISPVEQSRTPVTPVAKMEPASPFNIDNVSPHNPLNQQFSASFDPPSFFPTTAPSATYGMQAPVPQEVTYDQTHMYQNAYDVHQMEQQRAFVSIESTGLNDMNHGRAFGSMDSAFSHTIPDQSYNPHQTPGYSIAHSFVSGPPVSSGYQAPDMLGLSDAGYGFSHMGVNEGQNFHQVQMSRPQGSTSPYGHSPQNGPNGPNGPYYGHQ